jgi:predicted dehydrogenase
VAVIGVGYFGNLHAEKYAESANADLVAVCDIVSERADSAATRYSTEPALDYRHLFGRVDAVSVVVPTNVHHAITKDFLEQGIHVLVEKPISSSLKEADDLIRIAAANELMLQVGHLERFNPAVLGLEHVLSRPRFIECRRTSPYRQRGTDTNVVLDLMIHDIDLILDIVKSPIERIEAIGVPVLSEVEDIADARIRFADGCIATFTASRVSSRTERTMRIFQNDAYILLDLNESRLSVRRKDPGAVNGSRTRIVEELQNFEPGDNLRRQIDSFLAAWRTGSAPLVTASDARRALEAALVITRQCSSNGSNGDIDVARLNA